MKPILKEHWLSLRDAAELIGREISDGDWSASVLNDPASQMHETIRSDLYTTFESGKVAVFFDDGRNPINLKAEHAVHFALNIDIPNDNIELGQLPGDKFACHINQEDLDKFLTKNRSSRSARAHTQKAETECLKWLEGLMRKESKKKSKEMYRNEAREKFGTGFNAFNRSWKKAIENTGSNHWSAEGRPKKSSH